MPLLLKQSIQSHPDTRGRLYVVNQQQLVRPFSMQRAFWITDVPEGTTRGEHANRSCTELVVAVKGSVKIWLTDGREETEVLLDSPDMGIYIPPMVWCRLTDFSADAVVLCLADEDYDRSTYINDYEAFLGEARAHI